MANAVFRACFLASLFLAMVPASVGMDGQTTGLGLLDLDPDEFYTDAGMRPEKKTGMSVEMKRMISSVEAFQDRTRTFEEDAVEESEKPLPEQKIPRKIWQFCPDESMTRLQKAYSRTWSNENPEYVHTVCTVEEADQLVRDFFPELVSVYKKLPKASKEDLWAYLVLFKFGGIYAAIDSTCEQPMKKLIEATDDMLVGLQPRLDSRVLARKMGIKHHSWPIQHWWLACAPGHPIVRFLIDYVAQNVKRRFCADNPDIDVALRSGAAPFNDAVTAFQRTPVPERGLRVTKIGAFAMGQAWGSEDKVTIPCARERHGYGFWFDNEGKKHMCDCLTRKERAKRLRGQVESSCFVRRRSIAASDARVKSLVRFPELARRRWKRRART